MKALIVIDVQHGLFASSPPPFDSQDVISRINALSNRARSHGVPVIFVQHEATTGDYFRHGSDAWKLDHRLETTPADHYVRKTTPDAFLQTALQAVLTKTGCTDVVVCGYATEFCIDTSVRRAAGLGYNVVLASDAHTTHDKAHATAAQIIAHHTATLPAIKSFGVQIVAQESGTLDFQGSSPSPSQHR
ncbi:cysteine hydrolase [Pseudomonas silvicola]|uniref:cysteine hydrolase family protein n=1 Tax=Pseudomonas sp. RIT-To-2 TaxID=3462541 RepID=UPI00227B1649|nr:cysteine hydrolase [Pseudomonas silvicola]